jgi:hypothetical protein
MRAVLFSTAPLFDLIAIFWGREISLGYCYKSDERERESKKRETGRSVVFVM